MCVCVCVCVYVCVCVCVYVTEFRERLVDTTQCNGNRKLGLPGPPRCHTSTPAGRRVDVNTGEKSTNNII